MGNNLTIRLPEASKEAWRRRAKSVGMSLNRYVVYVVDRARITTTVAVHAEAEDVAPP